jgi:hypothetical protein
MSLVTRLQQAQARQRAASARHDLAQVVRCKAHVAAIRALIARRSAA